MAATSSRPGNSLPVLNIRRLLLLDIALPVLAVVLLERQGAPALAAYAAAALFPAFSLASAWLRRRSVDPVGLGVLLGFGCALALGVVTSDPRFVLMRAAPAFALFGIACFVSLATARPLMFYVARAFSTEGDPARVALWNRRLAEVPRFQRAMRLLTAVWGAGSLVHAGVVVAAVLLLPAHVALIVDPAVAFVILAALLAWTRALQRNAPSLE